MPNPESISPKLHTPPTFEQLTQFVANSQLKRDVLALEDHPTPQQEQDTRALLEAIQTGDYYHPTLLEHPDCELYVLLLLKRERITGWQASTLIMYLMAQMQFTNQRDLPAEHAHLKSPVLFSCIEVYNILDENGRYTMLGISFFEVMWSKFPTNHPVVNANLYFEKELLLFVRALPPSEQIVFLLPYKVNKHGIDGLIKQLARFEPFIICLPCEKYMLTSHSLMSLLTQFFYPNFSLTPLPSYGSVSLATLLRLHTEQKHPCALYSPRVKHSLVTVHGFACGGIPAALHDWGHVIMASNITATQFAFIFDWLIPNLLLLAQNYPPMKAHLENAIYELNDLNLQVSRLDANQYVYLNFFQYIRKCLGIYDDETQPENLRPHRHDQMFIHILRTLQTNFAEISTKYLQIPAFVLASTIKFEISAPIPSVANETVAIRKILNYLGNKYSSEQVAKIADMTVKYPKKSEEFFRCLAEIDRFFYQLMTERCFLTVIEHSMRAIMLAHQGLSFNFDESIHKLPQFLDTDEKKKIANQLFAEQQCLDKQMRSLQNLFEIIPLVIAKYIIYKINHVYNTMQLTRKECASRTDDGCESAHSPHASSSLFNFNYIAHVIARVLRAVIKQLEKSELLSSSQTQSQASVVRTAKARLFPPADIKQYAAVRANFKQFMTTDAQISQNIDSQALAETETQITHCILTDVEHYLAKTMRLS